MENKKEKLEDFKTAISSTVRSIANSPKIEVAFGAQVAKTVKDFSGSLNDVVKSKDIAAITEQSDDPNWYCNCGKNILMEVSLTDKNSGEVRKAQKVIELKDTRLDLS